MGARDERIKQAREENRAQIAAIKAGGDFQTAEEINADDTTDVNPSATADALEGSVTLAQLVQQVRKLSRDNEKLHREINQAKRRNVANFKKFAKWLDKHIEVVVDRLSQVQADEANMHKIASGGLSDASTLLGGLEPMIRVFLTFVNSADKVQYPLALTLSETIRAYKLDTAGGEGMRDLIADALKAWAYYDPAVGFASIYSADAAAAPVVETPIVVA